MLGMDEKKNKKLVIIIIILLSIITLMTGYIVYDVFSSVDSNKEFNGNVVDTPNKDDNVEQDTGKDTTIEEDNDPGLSPINTKYKDFEFVRTTKLECVSLSSLDGISDEYSGGCFKTKIENGSIVFEGEEGQKFLSAGITNFKYITVFNNFMHDVGYSNLAALTDSGNLYFPLSVSEKEKKVYFKKFDYDKKIHEMFIAYETDGVYFDLLYVLNQMMSF